MRLYLPHRIKHNPHNDQETCASEKAGDKKGYTYLAVDDARQNRYYSKKHGTG